MPLARIRCRSHQDAVPFIERLNAAGYEVETAVPGEACESPAELEIELDNCSPDDVLARAEAFAREHPRGVVAVAAGALPPEADIPEPESERGAVSLVVNAISSWLKAASSRRSQTASQQSSAVSVQHAAEASGPSLKAEVRQAPIEDLALSPAKNETSPPPMGQEPAREPEQPLEDAARVAAARRQAEEQARQAELVLRAEEERRREQERLAREAEIARRNREAEAEVLRMAEEAWDQAAIASAGEGTARAVATERVPRAEPARCESLVPAQAGNSESTTQAAATPRMRTTVRPAPVRRIRPRQMVRRRARKPATQACNWSAAAVVGFLFAVLLMGAWSLVREPRPAAPLANQHLLQDSAIEQHVPFGPVRLTNQPQPVTPVTVRPSVVQVKRAAVPEPAQLAKPAPSAKPSPVRRRVARTSADDTAEDVVMIHQFRSAAPPSAPAQAKASTKRFSDVD